MSYTFLKKRLCRLPLDLPLTRFHFFHFFGILEDCQNQCSPGLAFVHQRMDSSSWRASVHQPMDSSPGRASVHQRMDSTFRVCIRTSPNGLPTVRRFGDTFWRFWRHFLEILETLFRDFGDTFSRFWRHFFGDFGRALVFEKWHQKSIR